VVDAARGPAEVLGDVVAIVTNVLGMGLMAGAERSIDRTGV
jgi:hypothetical protein